jgi:uridine phosphorylase
MLMTCAYFMLRILNIIIASVAFLYYFPLSKFFKEKEYEILLANKRKDIRYFVHLHPFHVMYCEYNSCKFVVLSEVYMGLGTTFLEELCFYGIKRVIGLGYVGSMTHPIGTNVFAERSLVENGTTPHYLDDQNIKYVSGSNNMCTDLKDFNIKNVTVWTTNGFYKETQNEVVDAINKGCDVVNMDTSHFYACGNKLDMNVTYYATVSDMMNISENNNKNDSQIDNEWKNEFDNILDNSENSCNNNLINNQKELIKFLIIKNTNIYLTNKAKIYLTT